MNEDKDRQIKSLATELIEVKEKDRMKQRVERRDGHFDLSVTGQLE